MERQPVLNAPHPLEGVGTSSDPFRSPDPQTSSTMQLMARPVVRNSFHRTAIIEFLSSMEATDIYLWYMERRQRDTAERRVFIENYDTIIPEISRRTKIAFDQRVVDVLCRHIVHHNGLVTHAMADFPPRLFQPWMHTIAYNHLEVLLLELSTAAESRKLDEQGANVTQLAVGYIERIRRFRHAACEFLTYMLMSRLILYQQALNPNYRRGDYAFVFELITRHNHHWVVEVLENSIYFCENDAGKLKGTMTLFGERYV